MDGPPGTSLTMKLEQARAEAMGEMHPTAVNSAMPGIAAAATFNLEDDDPDEDLRSRTSSQGLDNLS